MRTAGLNLHVPQIMTKDEFSLMGKRLLPRAMVKLAQVLKFQPRCGFPVSQWFGTVRILSGAFISFTKTSSHQQVMCDILAGSPRSEGKDLMSTDSESLPD